MIFLWPQLMKWSRSVTGESSLRTKFKPFSSQQALCDSSYSAFSCYLLLISHLYQGWMTLGLIDVFHLGANWTSLSMGDGEEFGRRGQCDSHVQLSNCNWTVLFLFFSFFSLVWSLVAICVMSSWAPRFHKSIHHPPRNKSHQITST